MPFPAFADVYPQSYTWRDAKGNTSTIRIYVDWNAGDQVKAATFAFALSGLITPLTWAAFQSAHGPYSAYGVAQYGAHNALGAYESVIDKAVMVFQDATGQLHRIMIPAPRVAIFLADKVTVDPANTAVAAFTAKMTGPDVNGIFAASRSDAAFVNFMGGYYAAKKLRRRVNVLTLTPPLTPAEPAE